MSLKVIPIGEAERCWHAVTMPLNSTSPEAVKIAHDLSQDGVRAAITVDDKGNGRIDVTFWRHSSQAKREDNRRSGSDHRYHEAGSGFTGAKGLANRGKGVAV